jgi:plastocyanin
MDAPAQLVEMNQQDCMYVPRVAAAVVGQKTIARNGDPILHNVHAYLGASTLFNRGMPNQKAAPLEYVLNQEGVVKWKCDVHPWMRGYLGVSRNNLQAVTGAAGAFRIENVPPGRYTLEAWHEKYGAKSQEVTVQPGVRLKVNFKFDGTEKT